MRHLFPLTAAFLLVPCTGISQVPVRTEQVIEERIENLARDAAEETDFTEIAEDLVQYAHDPIALNRHCPGQLRQLGLLSDIQVRNLSKHIEKHGNLAAVEELQAVDGFSADDIRRLLPYVTTGERNPYGRTTLSEIVGEGKHTLILRAQRVLEASRGYGPLPDGSTSRSYYLGDPWRYYSRYRFRFRRQISAGITAEKDPGEEFFRGTQRSFDYYSAHIFIRDLGPVKAVALGDYQLSYGQGLTIWTGLAFGKSAEALAVRKNARGITPYTSVNESLFKRGAAISLGSDKISLDMFYSHKGLDGNLTDTLEQIEFFSSFQETGYHRSYAELEDKNSITEDFFGAHAGYRNESLSVGVTAVHSSFDKSLAVSPALYNTFYFKGDRIINTGLDYSYLFRNVSFFGEAARSDNGGMAYLNGVLLSLDPAVSVSVVNRNYGKDYQALSANGLREGSTTINEKGTYVGVKIRPGGPFSFSGYFDVFTFPWLRYQVNAPSAGHEYMALFSWKPGKQLRSYARYRLTTKSENLVTGEPFAYPAERTQRNVRIDNVVKVSASITLHNRVEVVSVEKQGEGSQAGFLVLQDIAYRPLGKPLSFTLRYAFFDSDSYDARVYAYENDILYSYSIPAYYYQGSRYYLNVRYKLARGIDLWVRYAQWLYTNRESVGSGLDEIEGNRKSELKLQVRLQL